MAVDFSSLLKKPAGEAKKPEALPGGTYPGLIKGFELGDNNKNKTPYLRFHLILTGAAPGVDETELASLGIDLSKRTFRRDFYLKDKEGNDLSLWRLDDLLRSCGINPTGRGYDEVLPEMTGCAVQVEVIQKLGQDGISIINEINGLVGEG
jgi:hypothetical protein